MKVVFVVAIIAVLFVGIIVGNSISTVGIEDVPTWIKLCIGISIIPVFIIAHIGLEFRAYFPKKSLGKSRS